MPSSPVSTDINSVFNMSTKFAQYLPAAFSESNPQEIKNAWQVTNSSLNDRKDKRADDASREITFDTNILSRADGSVLYKNGNTHILATVNGPLAVDTMREKLNEATIEVSFKFRHSSTNGMASNDEINIAHTIRDTLSSTIQTHLYPRTLISICIQVVQDDGSLLASAINAAMLACLDASLNCSKIITAAAIAVAPKLQQTADKENDKKEHDNEQQLKKRKIEEKTIVCRLLTDPTFDEEASSIATTTFAFTNKPQIYNLDSTINKSSQASNTPSTKSTEAAETYVSNDGQDIIVPEQELVTCVTYGVWEIADYLTASHKAMGTSEEIYANIRRNWKNIEIAGGMTTMTD